MNTPTPWVLYAQMSVRDNEGRTVAEFNNPFLPRAECEANTAFVVRAVNSHQSLIDALSEAVNLFRGGDLTNEQAHALWKADAALALAKEPT